MVDRREQMAALTEELTELARELRQHRELLRVVMHPFEAGSGFSVNFREAKKGPGRKMRSRLIQEASSILSLEGNVMSTVGDTSVILFGFHEGEDIIERAIIERAARYIACQEGYEGAIECHEVPFLTEAPKTRYEIPEEWDTCMVHGMNINSSADQGRLARGNERRGLRVDQAASGEYVRIQRMPGTSVPQERLNAYCRALLAPLIRSGEGRSDSPGVHPEGLAVEFYQEEERQDTLNRVALYPSADETTMEFLLSPWQSMPGSLIHRAHQALRKERGVTLTIEEAEGLTTRLLDDEPRIAAEVRDRFVRQFRDRAAPDDETLRAMFLYLTGFETMVCLLKESAGFDFREHLEKGIVERVAHGKSMGVARQEALIDTRLRMEQGLVALTARGYSLGSDGAREGLLRVTPQEVALIVSQRLERPHLIHLLVTQGVRSYVQTYSRGRIDIDLQKMQAAMKAHVGGLIVDHYGPILHLHRREMREMLEAAHRNPQVRDKIPLLAQLGPVGVLEKSEKEAVETLLDVVFSQDWQSESDVAVD